MKLFKRYAQSTVVSAWQTCEWALDILHIVRPWIPAALLSVVTGFAIGYWWVGR
jgi:hypothetical protein